MKSSDHGMNGMKNHTIRNPTEKRTMLDKRVFDVAILGSGMAGSILATILARHGVSVVLIDRAEHPRFAIGESTIPHTSLMLRILAERFDVPEIADFSAFKTIHSNVATSCGLKRHFGFAYHREGQEHDIHEATQSVISEYPDGPESHLFRQDVDYYLLCLAIRYGVDVRQKVEVQTIEIDESVRLIGARGEEIEAKYLVDASGFRSLIASKYDLREQPTRLKTHSRALFTHMIGVQPFEDCIDTPPEEEMPRRWSQGTLHHIFDGGWLWVIPFNNHEDARNPVCSVGLSLDSRRFPKDGRSGAEEFADFLQRFPSIARQFEGARPVREWISTHRLQYSSSRGVGDRFCLAAHASGAIDALFSRGLANTMEVIHALVPILLEALKDGEFGAERFAYVEELQQRQLDYNDRLVNCSYIAFRDFPLWNAWYRIWVLGAFYGWLRLSRAHLKYSQELDRSFFRVLDNPRWLGSMAPALDTFEKHFDTATGLLEGVESGEVSVAEATRRLYELLENSPIVPPLFGLEDPEQRATIELNRPQLLQLVRWVKKSAPQEVRDIYYE